ncbi:MAG: ATP-binding cassette domain-containing protein [Desulfitobacteriia bacterium]|jgi:putative ABC transport system ATP-binding protein
MSKIAYLRGQWEWLASQAGIFVIINLILLSSTPLAKTLGEIFYLDLLVIVLAGAGYGFHFHRMNKVYGKIREALSGDEEIESLFKQFSSGGEYSVPGITLLEELLQYKNKSFLDKENDYRQRMNDLKDYLTQTVHDLKVNLAVCEMVAGRLADEPENRTEIAGKLLYQVELMKFRVSQALAITRANHYSEDILAEKVDLAQVVKEAIGDNAEFFIQKNISVHVALKQILKKVRELTELFGIEDQLDKYPYQLSGGQRQRAAVCRALVNDPKILCADEPTGALDSKASSELLACFQNVRHKFGTTVVMVTHDATAASYCDRVMFLKDGMISGQLEATASEVFFKRILNMVALLGGEQTERL